jgi:arylsulfatase A
MNVDKLRRWAVIAVVMGGAGAMGALGEDRPNLIYILLDDAGYGDLGCYGQDKFATPHIDRLAADGMRFTQHYSGSTVCAPTRCVLMTGVHSGRAYVRGNREVRPEGQAPMPADIVTLPRLLRGGGYVAGAFGKWGLGAPGSASDPMEHFDRFFGYNCQRQAHSYYPSHLWSDRERVELGGEVYAHLPIMEQTLAFVRENAGRPFFLYVPTPLPHAAMQAPEENMASFRERFSEFEGEIGRYGGTEVDNPVAGFAAMMTLLDEGVGELLDLLDELEIADKTLVMLSSDNGPHQEGGHRPEFFGSRGGFRGYKRDLYEGGIRVPLLARWPGAIEAGVVSDHISAHWDILPTFCELAGVEVPEGLDGLSMVPTLLGRAGEQEQHESLYWEFYEQGGKRAVRFGNWKGVQLGVKGGGFGAPVEIYDLEADPGEERDLAAGRPELVERARELMGAAHEPSENWEWK